MTCLLLCLALGARIDFEMPTVGSPISGADWAVTEDPEQDIYDAVILEDVTEITSMGANRYRRVRILSENGKRAAQLRDSTGWAMELKGRVIDRSGNETPFNSRKDFIRVLDASNHQEYHSHLILLPPGLTSDCIVEFSWQVFGIEGLPAGFYRKSYDVQSGWFVKKMQFMLNQIAFRPMARGSSLITRWVNYVPPPPAGLDRQEDGTKTLLTYTNIPAHKEHPFGRRYFDPMSVALVIYKSPYKWGNNAKQFWPRFGRDYMRDQHFGDSMGRLPAYEDWIKSLKTVMPEDPVRATIMVFNEFRQRMSSTDLLSHQKKAIQSELGSPDIEEYRYLATAFELGYGEPEILCRLFYKVATDLDLPVHVILTNSNRERQFEPEALDPFSLDIAVPIFGVRVDAGWILMTPARGEYPPGLIPSIYQGSRAVAFDIQNKWKTEFITLPRAGFHKNRLLRQYTITLTDDGQASLTVNRQSTGEFNAFTLRRLFPYPENERINSVIKDWQERLENWEISSASIRNADNITGTVEYSVNGAVKLDLEAKGWTAISPFPGAVMPLATPENWPSNRKIPVILPKAMTVVDISTIHLPSDWKIRGNPTWEKSNSVGKVSFKATQDGNKMVVQRDILIARDLMAPESEKELKYFCAWMEEAMYQTIGLAWGGDY